VANSPGSWVAGGTGHSWLVMAAATFCGMPCGRDVRTSALPSAGGLRRAPGAAPCGSALPGVARFNGNAGLERSQAHRQAFPIPVLDAGGARRPLGPCGRSPRPRHP